MTDRVNFTIANNADEEFSLVARFDPGEAPVVADISQIEMQVRTIPTSPTVASALTLTANTILLAAEHATDTIGFRLRFTRGSLAPGRYVHDIIATVDGDKKRWFYGDVLVETGVTR